MALILLYPKVFGGSPILLLSVASIGRLVRFLASTELRRCLRGETAKLYRRESPDDTDWKLSKNQKYAGVGGSRRTCAGMPSEPQAKKFRPQFRLARRFRLRKKVHMSSEINL